MVDDFSKNAAVCCTEPYVHFVDGNGRLNVGLFVEKVLPDTLDYYTHWHDFLLMEKVIAYERASRVEQLELLKVRHFLALFEVIPFSIIT